MSILERRAMERLTEVENGTAMVKGCGSNCKYGFEYCRKEDWENCKTIDDVIDKLAQYEDLEEQGLLLRLPAPLNGVDSFSLKENEIWQRISCHCKDCSHWVDGCAGCTEHVKLCDVGHYMVGENGYCLYAEKKLKETEGK